VELEVFSDWIAGLIKTVRPVTEIDVVWQIHEQQPMEILQMEKYFSYPIRGRLP